MENVTISNCRTVEKALNILETIAKFRDEVGLFELSKRAQMNKSTVYRFLNTLSNMGYVKKNLETNKYHLGFKILEMSQVILNRLELREVAKPYMKNLVNEIKETARLAILDAGEVVYIDQIDGDNPVKLEMRIGSHYPAHSTGAGKVLLAYLLKEELDGIIKKYGLTRYTKNTVTNMRTLQRQLQEIRVKGYSFNDREFRTDIRDIAAPIFDHNASLVACLTIVGPSYRLKGEKINKAIKLVKLTTQSISECLGYQRRMDKEVNLPFNGVHHPKLY